MNFKILKSNENHKIKSLFFIYRHLKITFKKLCKAISIFITRRNKMKNQLNATLILISLVIGFMLLLFSILTEWWIYSDYSKLNEINENIDILQNQSHFIKIEKRFKFKKFSSLFDTCDEYKWLSIIEPRRRVAKTDFSLMDSECSSNSECFCCKSIENKCIPIEKQCDAQPDCRDESDEIDCNEFKHETNSLVFKFYDKLNECYRYKYNIIEILNNLPRIYNESNDNNDTKYIIYYLIILFSFFLCSVFTILCFFTLIFLKCCSYVSDTSQSVKSEFYFNRHKIFYGSSYESSYEDYDNYHSYQDNGDNYYDYDDINDDSEYNINYQSKFNCFKCTYYLCPFIFYSIFSFLSLGFYLTGLFSYFYLIYLNYTFLLQNSQIYKLNTWLFDIQKFGPSFYLLLLSGFFYLLTVFLSIYITCRIQMSPQWRSRYSDTYEVLKMQETPIFVQKTKKKFDNTPRFITDI